MHWRTDILGAENYLRRWVDLVYTGRGQSNLPASDGKGSSGGRVRSRCGKYSVRDGGARWDRGGELHDSKVTVVGRCGVAGVDLDGRNAGGNAT